MAKQDLRAQLISAIWQAFAQSGVDLSGVPADQQEKLVSKITDSILAAQGESMLKQTPVMPSGDTVGIEEERDLWKGKPFLSLVERYTLTTDRLKITTGFLAKRVENFELVRVQDIDFKQAMGERMFGMGDITIRGHDASDPLIVLRNIRKPEAVYEMLRKAWLEARKRHGLQFREYM